jgi:hypothetical protein
LLWEKHIGKFAYFEMVIAQSTVAKAGRMLNGKELQSHPSSERELQLNGGI